MLIDDIGDVTITNDGATILKSCYNFPKTFCVQRTTFEQPHFLEMLKDLFKYFGTLIVVLAWNFDDGYRQCYVFDNIFLY